MSTPLKVLHFVAAFLFALPMYAQNKAPSERSDCPGDTVDRMGPEIARAARAFLSKLREAVQSGDKEQVASLVHYPLIVNTPGGKFRVWNRKELVAQYERVIDARVKAKIVDEKSSKCLFANPQGFMVGDGEVWFRETAPGRFKVVSINTDGKEAELNLKPEVMIPIAANGGSRWACSDAACRLIGAEGRCPAGGKFGETRAD